MMTLAASISLKPCTEAELKNRFDTRSPYGITLCVQEMILKSWIWEDKKGVLHCYRKTVNEILIPNEYNVE